MSLNFGPKILAIPGPSVMPERVLSAMHRPSLNIYEGELIEITESIYPDLLTVAQTKGQVAIYIANGHGAWEAALRNMFVEGDKILILTTGRFAANWGILAESIAIDVQVLNFGMQGDADPAKVAEILNADKNHTIKAVLTVQTDTASSVRNDVPALSKSIKETGHPALFMVDCIASLGCDEFRMDEWQVDVMIAACQKGLMTPAGISFVYFNDKAAEARKRAKPGQYWDWTLRGKSEQYYQKFCGTAPTQHIFGLREALNILVHEEGVEAVWKRHETISTAYWAAIKAWGEAGELVHNISDPSKRSRAVSTVTTGEGDAANIRKWTEQNAGVTLGIGLGFGEYGTSEFNRRFRIGHMGHQNIHMVMGVIGAIDCALKALNIPHGDGAMVSASRVLANHGH